MAQGAAQAVELPNDQAVAGAQLVQDLLEDRAVAAGAAGGFGKHPVAAGLLQGVDLELGVLVGGRDPGVTKQMSHGGTVAQPCDSGGCATLISDTSSGRRGSGLKKRVLGLLQIGTVSDSWPVTRRGLPRPRMTSSVPRPP